MGAEHLGEVCVVDFADAAGTDGDDVEDAPRVLAAESLEEQLAVLQAVRKRPDLLHLRLVKGIACEEQELEPGICRQEVLHLARLCVRAAHKDLR